MNTVAADAVTTGPDDEQLGFYLRPPFNDWEREHGPIIGVVQLIRGEWHYTGASWCASTLLDDPPIGRVSLVGDWSLSEDDTAALVAFARQHLTTQEPA